VARGRKTSSVIVLSPQDARLSSTGNGGPLRTRGWSAGGHDSPAGRGIRNPNATKSVAKVMAHAPILAS
jgi:hypothetical protein